MPKCWRVASLLKRVFGPAPHRPLLPEAEARRRYPGLRWAMLESTFLGWSLSLKNPSNPSHPR